jgi:outer membrane protein OmpA-like peptidoglycan-associated protein/uncharacterized membrane protein YeaQ/YmgE (transglycosylase-associated protein family)
MELLIYVLLWLLFGLIAGGAAKLIMPGRDPGGIIATIVLGILGSLVGGFIAHSLGYTAGAGWDWRNLVLAIGGALLLLLAYRAFMLLSPSSVSSPAHMISSGGSSSHGYDTPAATNLIDLTKKALPPDLFQKLSAMVGESPNHTKKALEAMVPSILAEAASQAATPSGANHLFNLAKETATGTDLVSNLASHLEGGGIESITRTGQSILNTLFGDKLGGLLSWFSRFAGIKGAATTTLMSVASTLVMNLLGKQILQHGLDPSGLSHLLAGQKSWVSRLLPSGITEVPGMSALADFGGRAAAAARGAAEYGERAAAAAQGTARDAYRGTVSGLQGATPWLSALLPLFLIGLPLLAFPFVIQGCAGNAPLAQGPVAKLPEVKAPDARLPEVKAPDIKLPEVKMPDVKAPDLSKLVQVKLPDGVDLGIPEGSFLNRVYSFLTNKNDITPRTFVFDNLHFDGATVKMAPETETSVKVLSTLLKAFPTVKLRIDGHTDNTVEAAEAKRVSLERANAVKELLVKAGIPAERITTEGYGSEKPLAPNDTEAGRAQNRRVELTVVKS